MYPENRMPCSQAAFTLIEMMVTVAISSGLMMTIMMAYDAQQKTYLVQEQITEMQQNLRAAANIMTEEIRMAGYDPKETNGVHVVAAFPGRFGFEMDRDENGSVKNSHPRDDETPYFGFANDQDNAGGIPDGIPDDYSPQSLGRAINTTATGTPVFQPLADNIQFVEFGYHLRNPATGVVNPTPVTNPGTGDYGNIRSVTVTLIARSEHPDPNYTNTENYVTTAGNIVDLNPDPGETRALDNFRRRMLTFTVKCRNLGLKD